MAEFLTHEGESASLNTAKFNQEWGIDTSYATAGGLKAPEVEMPQREIFLLQRKQKKLTGPGKTTGWIHRAGLEARDVKLMPGVSYDRIDDQGLHITVNGEVKVLEVDNIVLCAGQESERSLFNELQDSGLSIHLIGGADVAAELDARRAIDQGVRLAAKL